MFFADYEEDYPEDFLQQGEERMREIEKRHKERVRRDDTTETKYIELVMVADSKEVNYRLQKALPIVLVTSGVCMLCRGKQLKQPKHSPHFR